MPGPGPHLIYALGSGLTLMSLSGARFGPHHCLVYAINAFFGPDVGSFVEWRLISRILRREVDPRSPLLYSAASRLLVSREIIDSFSGVTCKKIKFLSLKLVSNSCVCVCVCVFFFFYADSSSIKIFLFFIL